MIEREDIVAAARDLVGTPFHESARIPGEGIDCVGVVVFTGAAVGSWPRGFDVLPYSQYPDKMKMRSICRKHMTPIRKNEMQRGDVVLVVTDRFPQHLGIVGDWKGTHHLSIIHASLIASPPRVLESPLMFSRSFRFLEAYRFPGVA